MSDDQTPVPHTKSQQVRTGAWMLTGLAAACFASLLTAIGGGLKGGAVTLAMCCFAVAIPLLVFMTAALSLNQRSWHVPGGFVLLASGGGTCVGVAGLVSLVYTVSPLAAILFLVTTLWSYTMYARQEGPRAEKGDGKGGGKGVITGSTDCACSTAGLPEK